MPRPIRAVLFDLGETLVNLDKSWEEVFELEVNSLYQYLNGTGMKIGLREFTTLFTREFEAASTKANSQHVETPMEEIMSGVIVKSGVRTSREGFLQTAIEEFYRPEIQSWQLDPDTLEVLVNLENKFLLGLISNAKSEWQVNSILRKFQLERFFKIILISATLRIRKPRPDLFLKALSSLNITPDKAVFVGNSLEADIAGARAVGIRSIHLQKDSSTAESFIDPEATVSSLSEVVKIVNDWSNGT